MSLLAKYRFALTLFILDLVLSGITAFPLAWELRLVTEGLGINASLPPETHTGISFWLASVDQGLQKTYAVYPWMAYGTDWLAFAHLVIAVYFIGPLINPVKNEWVIYAGLIGCVLVMPLALISGPLRGIPFYWRVIDCSFGVLGAVPLLYCLHLTRLIKAVPGAMADCSQIVSCGSVGCRPNLWRTIPPCRHARMPFAWHSDKRSIQAAAEDAHNRVTYPHWQPQRPGKETNCRTGAFLGSSRAPHHLLSELQLPHCPSICSVGQAPQDKGGGKQNG